MVVVLVSGSLVVTADVAVAVGWEAVERERGLNATIMLSPPENNNHPVLHRGAPYTGGTST